MTDEIRTSVEVMESSALDFRRGLATTNPSPPPCAETTPLPKSVTQQAAAEKSPAQWAYERVILYIKNFEEQLDAQHEVAMGFTGGDAGILKIEGIGWFAPDILSFYGEDENGVRTQLIQHVSQLNVLLRAMPKSPEAAEARRIGFRLAEGLGYEPEPAAPARAPSRKPRKHPRSPDADPTKTGRRSPAGTKGS